MPSFRRSNNNSSTAARSSPLTNANPDASLPPPPPYIPVDRNSSSRPSAAQQAVAHDSQPIYNPPPGPPPGASASQPAVQQASYPPSNYNANRPPQPQSNNPFADDVNSNSNLSSYPAMQPQPSALVQSPTVTGSQPFSTSPTSSSIHQPARQGSVSAHARRLSEDFNNMSVGSPATGGGGSVRRNVKEDPLQFLASFDTIFIVDDSSSMHVNEQPDGSMGKSRWEDARDALCGIVELASKYDDDGCDIHFLNDERSLENCREPQKVRQLFDQIDPNGITETGTKLEMLLLQYLDDIETYKELKGKGDTKGMKEPKKRNYIILTDGAATDDPESVIVSIAKRLDAGKFPLSQIGISFIQVGDDAEAKEALEELDDALAKEHGIRDMVDTTTYNGMVLSSDMVVKALLGGINRRMDKKKNTTA